MNSEIRSLVTPEFQLRAKEENSRTLIGYAAVYNSLSEDLGGFRERILPGAFTNSIRSGKIKALNNHDSGQVLASQEGGTLILTEDNIGVRAEIHLGNQSYANDLLESINRKDLKGMSFRFSGVVGQGIRRVRDKGELIQELVSVDVPEVSAVAFPAYPATSIGLRSLDERANKVMALITACGWNIPFTAEEIDAAREVIASLRSAIPTPELGKLEMWLEGKGIR